MTHWFFYHLNFVEYYNHRLTDRIFPGGAVSGPPQPMRMINSTPSTPKHMMRMIRWVSGRGGTRLPSVCDYLQQNLSLWRLSMNNRHSASTRPLTLQPIATPSVWAITFLMINSNWLNCAFRGDEVKEATPKESTEALDIVRAW